VQLGLARYVFDVPVERRNPYGAVAEKTERFPYRQALAVGLAKQIVESLQAARDIDHLTRHLLLTPDRPGTNYDDRPKLIAFCRSKTVSKAVHAPPADGPCRKAGTVCVGVNLISADGTPGVSVAVSVRAYTLVADRACRSAVAVTVSADVLATDPACRVAVSISVRVHSAISVYTCRITRSIRVKDGALGVQRRNGYRQHQHCKDGACHRTPLLLLVCRDQSAYRLDSGGKGRLRGG